MLRIRHAKATSISTYLKITAHSNLQLVRCSLLQLLLYLLSLNSRILVLRRSLISHLIESSSASRCVLTWQLYVYLVGLYDCLYVFLLQVMLLLLCGLHDVLQLKVVSGTPIYSNDRWDHSVWLSGGKVLLFLVTSYHSASALGTFQLRLRQF